MTLEPLNRGAPANPLSANTRETREEKEPLSSGEGKRSAAASAADPEVSAKLNRKVSHTRWQVPPGPSDS